MFKQQRTVGGVNFRWDFIYTNYVLKMLYIIS